MKLTKTVPTKPGYYWAVFAPTCPFDQVSICDTGPVFLNDKLRVLEIGYDLDMPPEEFYWGDEISREPIPAVMACCEKIADAVNEAFDNATTREPVGLKLSAYRQDWLAEVASKARKVKYDHETIDYAELGAWFAEHVVENTLSPQDFDDIYDRLHRTGSNA